MAQKKIIFRLTAFSAAAGKYNPQAPLDGNEDNFYVDDDLNDDILGRFQTDERITMSECGCLMVVADGMGGMNAGEVASEIAIDTVKDFFAPGKISPTIAISPVERRKYLEHVIKEADKRIKTDAKENPAHVGMGSTIIMAWIVGDKMTVSWCGDSRAYRFNPTNGLEPLSRDHSYVQELVNQGALKYEDTFEHPQGNIVTRSLGDPNNSAKPETRQFEVYNEDIILLCSDGLSGVLRDRKTKDHNGVFYPGENIEDIIASHTSSMTECRDALLEAAEKADWYDNVTVLLCQIESGADTAPIKKIIEGDNQDKDIHKIIPFLKNKILLVAGSCLLLVAILCWAFYYLGVLKGEANKPIDTDTVVQNDSIQQAEVVTGVDVTETGESLVQKEVDEQLTEKNEVKKAADKIDKSGKADKAGKTGKPEIVAPESESQSRAQNEQSQWKAFLLSKLNRYSQPALKNVISDIRQTITSAADNDQAKCTALVEQAGQRALYLEMLRKYNGRLTKNGETKFDALLLEIGNPRTFNPDYWKREIPNLSRYLSGEDDTNRSENNNGNRRKKNTPDSPNELTEI